MTVNQLIKDSGKNSSEKNLVVQFISTHFNISVHYNLRQELKITDVGDCDTNLECVNTCEGVVMVVEREKKCKCWVVGNRVST